MLYAAHFVWMEVVQDGTEGQAISPGRAEVGDLYPLVPAGDVLTPLQQRLAGVHQALEEEEEEVGMKFGFESRKEFKCTSVLCIFTSAASSFPSASSLTNGTGPGDLRSEVSSSGNVGSRDVFISQ